MKDGFPERWRAESISNCCNVIKEQGAVGVTPYLEIGDIDIKNKTYIFKEKASIKGCRLAKQGDILISRVRPTRGAIIKIQEKELFVSSTFTILRPKDNLLSDFLHYYLAWNKDFLANLGMNSRGAMYPTVSEAVILNYKIPLPSLSEQRQIVSKINGLNCKINEACKTKDNVIKEVDSIFNNIQRQIFGSKVSNSKKWGAARLDEISEVIYGISEAISKNIDQRIGIPIVRMANISLDGNMNLDDMRYIKVTNEIKEKYLLKNGDLLLNWRSGSPIHVGKTALFDRDGEYVFASFLLRIRPNSSKVLSKYLWYLLNFMRSEGIYIGDQRMQINYKMNAREFSAIKVLTPSIDEQQEIIDYLDNISIGVRELYNLEEKTQTELYVLTQSIFSKAFRGEL